MHTWTFEKDSKLIRFYSWLWKAEGNINFCKLFWGFFPPFAFFALIAHILIFVVTPIARFANRVTAPTRATLLAYINAHKVGQETSDEMYARLQKILDDENAKAAKKKAKKERGPNGFQRFLAKVSAGADRIVALLQSHEVAVTRVLFVIGAACLLATAALIVIGLVAVPWAEVWKWIVEVPWLSVAAVVAGSATLLGGIILLGTYIEAHNAQVRKFGKWLRPKKRIITTFHFFKDGVHSVKYRTCPKIVLT